MQSVKKRKREAEKRAKASKPKPKPWPPAALKGRIRSALLKIDVDYDALTALYKDRKSAVQPTQGLYDECGNVLAVLTVLIERYDKAKAAYDKGIGNPRPCDREREQRGLAYHLDLAIDRIGLALGDGSIDRPFEGWAVKLLLALGRTGHNLRNARIGDIEGDPLSEMEREYEDNVASAAASGRRF